MGRVDNRILRNIGKDRLVDRVSVDYQLARFKSDTKERMVEFHLQTR